MHDTSPSATVNNGASAAEIQAHYDVGNEFYSLWLDEGMNYSCALWEANAKDADLAQAQLKKLDFHIEKANASSRNSVLDIGCGWGAMLHRLTQVHGVRRAVGLTLSEQQAQWISRRNMERVEVRLEPWQEHVPGAPYDAIISVGAFEHFARPGMSSQEKIKAYRAFFEKCASWLVHPGKLSLQTIGHGCVDAEKREQTSQMSRLVFPGTELPRLQEVIAAAEGVLSIESVVNHAQHYQQTCRLWRINLMRNEDRAVELHGERVYQHYVDYLQNCEFGFALENLALFRIVLAKPRNVFTKGRSPAVPDAVHTSAV